MAERGGSGGWGRSGAVRAGHSRATSQAYAAPATSSTSVDAEVAQSSYERPAPTSGAHRDSTNRPAGTMAASSAAPSTVATSSSAVPYVGRWARAPPMNNDSPISEPTIRIDTPLPARTRDADHGGRQHPDREGDAQLRVDQATHRRRQREHHTGQRVRPGPGHGRLPGLVDDGRGHRDILSPDGAYPATRPLRCVGRQPAGPAGRRRSAPRTRRSLPGRPAPGATVTRSASAKTRSAR